MMDGGLEGVAQMMMVGGDDDSEVIGEESGDFSESQAPAESVVTKENGLNFHKAVRNAERDSNISQ